MTKENKIIKCITCNIKFDIRSDTKPFCSKRCSYIDLKNWFEEKYSIHINEEDYEKDFYKIDGSLFSPATVLLNSKKSGQSYSSGEVSLELVEQSFKS